MSKQRGNPSWGKAEPRGAPVCLSDFEYVTKSLGLSPDQYVHSVALKDWVCRNKNHKYVPPELLMAWGLTVNG